jgi:hypothetical protein
MNPPGVSPILIAPAVAGVVPFYLENALSPSFPLKRCEINRLESVLIMLPIATDYYFSP